MRIIAWLIICALWCPANAAAQILTDRATPQPIRQSIANVDLSRLELRQNPQSGAQKPAGRQRSIGRKIAGGAIGGVGGFFAGGYLGAAIDGDCGGCDDPGFLGALIGAPIGAAIGAILGVKFF